MTRMNWRQGLRAAILGVAAMMLVATSAMADEPGISSDDINALIHRLEKAEAKIGTLETELKATRQSSPSEALDQKLQLHEEDEKCVDVSGEKFSVKVGGRIQWDNTYGTDSGLAAAGLEDFLNGHEFRRVRLFASGKGYGIFDYKVQIDFADFNNPVAKDIYLGLTESPIGKIWIGHFKEPFSLEQLTSSKYITFLERSLTDAMVPGRNMGVMAFDNWGADGNGTWALGMFWDDRQQEGDDADDDGNVNNTDEEFRTITARVTYLPVNDADGRCLVHVGAAFRHVEVEEQFNRVRFRARPEIHDTGHVLGVRARPGLDTYQQYGLELAAVRGPASVQAEYIITDFQDRFNSNLDGFYVYASYFLTGEHRPYSLKRGSFGRVKPLENFWWVDNTSDESCSFGLGAWELAARYSTLDWIDDGLESAGGGSDGVPGELDDFTLGVNWYWNPHMRVMFNYVHSDLDTIRGRDADIDAFLTRFQVDF